MHSLNHVLMPFYLLPIELLHQFKGSLCPFIRSQIFDRVNFWKLFFYWPDSEFYLRLFGDLNSFSSFIDWPGWNFSSNNSLSTSLNWCSKCYFFLLNSLKVNFFNRFNSPTFRCILPGLNFGRPFVPKGIVWLILVNWLFDYGNVFLWVHDMIKIFNEILYFLVGLIKQAISLLGKLLEHLLVGIVVLLIYNDPVIFERNVLFHKVFFNQK